MQNATDHLDTSHAFTVNTSIYLENSHSVVRTNHRAVTATSEPVTGGGFMNLISRS